MKVLLRIVPAIVFFWTMMHTRTFMVGMIFAVLTIATLFL